MTTIDDTAAALAPVIHAEVKRAQAQALRDAADYIDGAEPKHLGDLDVDPLDYSTGGEYGIDCAAAWLRNYADRIEKAE